MIYVASDHGGFRPKKVIVAWLKKQGWPVSDLGPMVFNRQDDYPFWAAAVAKKVQHSKKDLGILLCRSGVGMAIAANKFSGVRATQALNPQMAKKSRLDENANVLSLSADYQTFAEMQRIVKSWLTTAYIPKPRYQRRLRELSRLEHGR